MRVFPDSRVPRSRFLLRYTSSIIFFSSIRFLRLLRSLCHRRSNLHRLTIGCFSNDLPPIVSHKNLPLISTIKKKPQKLRSLMVNPVHRVSSLSFRRSSTAPSPKSSVVLPGSPIVSTKRPPPVLRHP